GACPSGTLLWVRSQAPVWRFALEGTWFGFVAVQLLALGLYLPPVSGILPLPPQTIISLPVHTAVCWLRALGALEVLVCVQLSVLGLYLPPVLKTVVLSPPPHMIISLPVLTIAW